VQLIGEPRTLFGLSLDPRRDSTQSGERRGFPERFARSFDDGITSHGKAFRGIALPLGRMCVVIVFVALWLTDRNGHGEVVQRPQKRFEIRGILTSGINSQMDVSLGVQPMQLLQLRLQLLVTAAGFSDRQGFGNGLFVFSQKRHVMSEPRRIDSHAEMSPDGGVGGLLLLHLPGRDHDSLPHVLRHADSVREFPPQSFDTTMLVIRRSVPHHVPVVSRQRWEGSNLTARGRASILKRESLTAPIKLIATPPRCAMNSFCSRS
jgi:hypothetical protein